ncbi:hypothetical protein Tco_0080273 [Tanacetum coccineum]
MSVLLWTTPYRLDESLREREDVGLGAIGDSFDKRVNAWLTGGEAARSDFRREERVGRIIERGAEETRDRFPLMREHERDRERDGGGGREVREVEMKERIESGRRRTTDGTKGELGQRERDGRKGGRRESRGMIDKRAREKREREEALDGREKGGGRVREFRERREELEIAEKRKREMR